MNKLIQWPRAKYWDKAWNPVVGCRAVSPACEHCWAREWMGRFPQYGGNFEPRETKAGGPPRKGVVFCGNMTDLFGEWVERPSDYLLQTVGGDATAYLYLTKRVARMCARLNDTLGFVDEEGNGYFRHYYNLGIENHYFGITAENQEWFAKRGMEVLKNFPEWANLWVSMEPLLGPIEAPINGLSPLPKWVVVGCESGRNRRPCRVEWVESIVEECRNAGVPVFVKQLDLGGKVVADINKFPEHLRVRQVPWGGLRRLKG